MGLTLISSSDYAELLLMMNLTIKLNKVSRLGMFNWASCRGLNCVISKLRRDRAFEVQRTGTSSVVKGTSTLASME
ncbi:MAG TPA: hypothetical protein IGS53_20505 [Leptolyngbyaceae cyanobacterium M33_DOE_097]|uniref:Uncharacterized protein n=1 Tax=Oscillatoriales cyanobacterium SpSt-418 TaxID=2282169 RepID=A0A7C3PRX6_9CYAN|nr:hypothetical protein [Leptolyngbyaceae cyanobacterium M33_DOE_097]